MMPTLDMAIGRIRAWGQMFLHEDGFRAQHASVDVLFALNVLPPGTVMVRRSGIAAEANPDTSSARTSFNACPPLE